MTVLTSPAVSSNGVPATLPTDFLFRLSVQQYHEMIDAAILTADDRVELLDGLLVRRMPIKPPHRLATELTRRALERVLPNGWHANVQQPITTAESEPEPDVTVVRGNPRDYSDRHPGPTDVGLLVEVADTSLTQDRELKKPLYARAGLPVYWIINLPDQRIEVYTDPTGPADRPDYRQRQDFGPGDTVPVVLDGREVGRLPVRDLLP